MKLWGTLDAYRVALEKRVNKMPVPVAQLVERWTPVVRSTRPGYKSPRV